MNLQDKITGIINEIEFNANPRVSHNETVD